MGTEPVNDTAFTGSAFTIASPTSPPEPQIRLTTPLGMPASWQASASLQAHSGAAVAGFTRTVFPATKAGASFHAGMALGKFQGLICATTPSGRRTAYMNTRSRSEGTWIPGMREPSPPKYRKILIERIVSPLASGSVLPSSRVISCASVSRLRSRMSATLYRYAPRAGPVNAAHAGNASWAASAATLTSAWFALQNSPTRSSESAGFTFSNKRSLLTHSPSM